MALPEIKSAKKLIREEVGLFSGIDLRHGAKDGALKGCENLSHDASPALRSRAARKVEQVFVSPTSLFSWDEGLVVCDGNSVLYNGEVCGTVSSGEKQFAVVGSKLCIFPDKVYVDLQSGQFKPLATSVTLGGDAAEFTENSLVADHINYVGEYINYTNALYIQGDPLPHVMTYESVLWDSSAKKWTKTGPQEKTIADLAVGDIFIPYRISSSTKPWAISINYGAGQEHRENQEGYYAKWKDFIGQAMWENGNFIGTNFYDMKFDLYMSAGTVADFRDYFTAGDAVTVAGCAAAPENSVDKVTLLEVQEKTLVFDCAFTPVAAETALVTVTRQVPDLDFICQCGDRLCGVSNALENDVYDEETGTFVTVPQRAVYVSAAGNPERFWKIGDSDSRAVASMDDFTGCAGFSGDALFFKEAAMYRLAGLGSNSRRLYAYDVEGVQKGSHKSLCVVNEVLYYKGCHGVYAYSGASPKLISGAFGQMRFTNAAAGTDGLRYHVAMTDGDGQRSLFVYDSAHHCWLREDAGDIKGFTRRGSVLYMLSGDTVYSGGGVGSAAGVQWQMEWPVWGDEIFAFKNYRRVFLELTLGEGADFEVLLSENGGEFSRVFRSERSGEHTISLPVKNNRCKTLSLKLQGSGDCCVKRLGREFFTGSEV
ncbi:MAG: hypothetical protein IJP23_03875 [Oscillospiraceae bacterium]|nr:hypothetical protein [Oscillospiraceae bacterium]